jgi:hypothetical protein
MTGKIIVIGMLLVLIACKTAEDRQWSDMQAIIELTQPKKLP